MSATKNYVDSKSWLNSLEDLGDTITVSNPGAVTGGVVLNPGAGMGWAYPNTITGSNTTYTISGGTGITQNPWSTESTMNAGKLNLNGDNADLVINGVSLMEILRDRLNVMIPNPALEKEWDQLKALGDQYRELEANLKEQGDMWARLKAMPPVDPL
jgi:hypothetical protein